MTEREPCVVVPCPPIEERRIYNWSSRRQPWEIWKPFDLEAEIRRVAGLPSDP